MMPEERIMGYCNMAENALSFRAEMNLPSSKLPGPKGKNRKGSSEQ